MVVLEAMVAGTAVKAGVEAAGVLVAALGYKVHRDRKIRKQKEEEEEQAAEPDDKLSMDAPVVLENDDLESWLPGAAMRPPIDSSAVKSRKSNLNQYRYTGRADLPELDTTDESSWVDVWKNQKARADS